MPFAKQILTKKTGAPIGASLVLKVIIIEGLFRGKQLFFPL